MQISCGLLILCLFQGSHSLVLSRPSSFNPSLAPSLQISLYSSILKSRATGLNLRLAGGSDEAESEKDNDAAAVPQSNEPSTNQTETLNATALEKPPPSPEMIQSMNYRLWEAARDGNEPLVEKALKAGANVNAFCRGPDKWMNISVGEIAGADEYTTGLNVHWMELNNYTALHLAAASGNAAVIDKV